MSKTRRKKFTKKELVTDPLHTKAGPHKENVYEPKVCPACRGSCIEEDYYEEGFHFDIACTECGGEGIV